MTKYSTGFFYPFFLIIRAGAYEGWRWRVAFDIRGIGEDSPESGAYSCGGIGKSGRTAASGVIRNGTEILTAKAKGTSDSSFLWRIKGKEAGEDVFSPASFCVA